MPFTAEQLEERRRFIGASEVPQIMNGSWHDLWLVKTGRAQQRDLSDIFAVQLGIVTETLHLDWFERRVGDKVTRRGHAVMFPLWGVMRCTLDGWWPGLPGPIQAKHVNCRSNMVEVRNRYYPQVTAEMICTGARKGILSVIIGTEEPVRELIEFDDFYAEELIDRCREFWRCVESDQPPNDAPPAAAPPIAVETMRIVDMSKSNAWGEHAATWLENKKPAEKFNKATVEIKALVEADVKEASGAGIIAKRSKAGAISIKKD